MVSAAGFPFVIAVAAAHPPCRKYQGLKMHLLETYSPEFFNGHKGLVQQTMRDSMLAQQQVAEENKKKQRKQQSSKQQSQSRGGQANDEAKAKGFTNRSGPENVLSNDDEEELDEEELAAQVSELC